MENAAVVGAHLMGRLRELQQRHLLIGDVRGLGLMQGIELVDPDGAPDRLGRPPADGALASRLQRECLRRGLILELGGRHGAVARFLPPLIIQPVEIDTVVRIVGNALEAAVAA